MYSGHLGDWYIGLDTQTLLPKALFKFFFQLYSNKKYVELLIGDFAMHVIILKWLKTQKYNKKRKTMRQRGQSERRNYQRMCFHLFKEV